MVILFKWPHIFFLTQMKQFLYLMRFLSLYDNERRKKWKQKKGEIVRKKKKIRYVICEALIKLLISAYIRLV